MSLENKNIKKSQITIFVIIAIVIIIAIVLAFVIIKKPFSIISGNVDANTYLSGCIKDSLTSAEKEIIDGNGYINMTNNFMIYQGKKVKYMCSVSQFYSSCINQEPMFIEHIRKEIENKLKTDSSSCFSDLFNNLNKKGYSFSEGSNSSVDVSFKGKEIIVNINKDITIRKVEDIQTYNKFYASIQSPVYNLAKTAQAIVNYESTYCEFNTVTWQLYYRDIGIKRFITSDQTKVYTIQDKDSGKNMSIAIKSCVLPAGI